MSAVESRTSDRSREISAICRLTVLDGIQIHCLARILFAATIVRGITIGSTYDGVGFYSAIAQIKTVRQGPRSQKQAKESQSTNNPLIPPSWEQVDFLFLKKRVLIYFKRHNSCLRSKAGRITKTQTQTRASQVRGVF